MYNEYFGLKEAPFSIAPNPQYLYMSRRHREALAHLLYGIKSDGGFILLTGEVGTGKTTICRCLLEQIPENVEIAFVLNPKLTAVELLATICDDLGISYAGDPSIKQLVDVLNTYLLNAHQQGKRTVLIIDEAQNLSTDVLEQLRLLTNLETNQRKLLQIILLGQPELLPLLARKELRQLSQRITARFHLDALNREEVREYISHRLSVAGARGNFFSAAAVNRIFKKSKGIPRVINLICDRALLGTYADNKLVVGKHVVLRAAREVLGDDSDRAKPWTAWMLTFTGFAGAALIGAVLVGAVTNYTAQSSLSADPSAPEIKPAESDATTDVVLTSQAGSSAQASTPEEPIPISLDSVSEVVGNQDQERALGDLFALWGIAFENEVTRACEQAPIVGLRCFTNLGSLTDIGNLDRPVQILLNSQWVTLAKMHDDRATIISGDRQYEISSAELVNHWDGNYTMVWRIPPEYHGPVAVGGRGKSVEWLIRQLSLVDGNPDAGPNQIFDNSIEARVKRFQLSVNLVPDGIVGIRTWIHLNSINPLNQPTLNQAGN